MLESLARMQLSLLELRYQHQRLRTKLELFLGCPLADLAGEEPAPAAELLPTPAAEQPE